MASVLSTQIRDLFRAGKWYEIRAMESVIDQLQGAELAKAHATLYMAYYHTANDTDDWRTARKHALAILSELPRTDVWYAWGLQAVACASTYLRRPKEAKAYAKAFLRLVPQHPRLSDLIPHVWQQLAFCAQIEQQQDRAVHCYRIALNGFESLGDNEEASRSRLFLVWALLKADRDTEAEQRLPAEVPSKWATLWYAARAVIAVRRGRWEEAQQQALQALKGSFESVSAHVAAEMCLVLAQASLRHGARAKAISWIKTATEFRARQGQGVLARLVLATRAEGGDFFAAVASRGSGGYHPEASLSTGVGG